MEMESEQEGEHQTWDGKNNQTNIQTFSTPTTWVAGSCRHDLARRGYTYFLLNTAPGRRPLGCSKPVIVNL